MSLETRSKYFQATDLVVRAGDGDEGRMVKSSEHFLKRGRRSRPNVTRDKVSAPGISRRFLTWTFTLADHVGTSHVYPMEGRTSCVQTVLGWAWDSLGWWLFHITCESLLGAEAQAGRGSRSPVPLPSCIADEGDSSTFPHGWL